ncbi:MAG TPA: hypothetical protein VHT97_06040 [Acidimicrobiales bacterium]|nr:hypothetical protein [Acidimicrobiales bacterium]
MAANPPPDLVLSSLTGRSRSVREWVTTFHLLFVAVDPASSRSRWIVPTAARVLTEYEQADCRVAWLVAGDAADARRFLGRWATDILTFADPELVAIKGFGLQTLPAIVHVNQDLLVVDAVEGWEAMAWRALTVNLSRQMKWSRPLLPAPGDPGPFDGAPLPRL